MYGLDEATKHVDSLVFTDDECYLEDSIDDNIDEDQVPSLQCDKCANIYRRPGYFKRHVEACDGNMNKKQQRKTIAWRKQTPECDCTFIFFINK